MLQPLRAWLLCAIALNVKVMAECGEGLDGDPCAPCSAGTYKSVGDTSCVSCSIGYACPQVISYDATSLVTVIDDGGATGPYTAPQTISQKLSCPQGERVNHSQLKFPEL